MLRPNIVLIGTSTPCGHANESNRRAGTCDSEGRRERFRRPDALDGRVDADAIRQFQDGRSRPVTALGDDVRSTECAGQRLAGRVPAEGDDPLRTQPPSRNERAQTDRAVPDDGDNLARLYPGAHRRVVACRHDIGERQQRAHGFI
jgi:hypothetical protein